MRQSAFRLLLALSVLFLVQAHPLIAMAEEGSNALSEAAAYFRSNFGVAVKQVTLDISHKDGDDTVALLEGDLILWPFLSFQSPTRYFGDSRFGWLMEYGLSGFDIDRQSEPFSYNTAADLGTGARGWFLYAMPTLTWDLSDTFRLGFGAGGGFMSLKGDALIYDPSPTVNRIKYNLAELAWGAGLMAEYVRGNFMIGLHGGGLFTDNGPYEYSVIEASLIISYHRRL